MNARKLSHLVLTATLLVFLAACQTAGAPGDGTHPDPDDPNDNPGSGGGVTRLGFVMVDESAVSDEVVASGAFVKFDVALPSGFLDNPFAAELDSCEVFSGDDEAPLDIPVPGDTPNVDFAFLDAGAELTLSAGGVTYAALPKRTFSFGGETALIYGSSAAYPRPIPSGLRVDIPGASGGFPAFSSAAFGEVSSFELSAPAAGPITPETRFSWVASEGDDTFVTLAVSAFDVSTGGFTAVSCTVQDDGSFSFPAATKAEMGDGFRSMVFSAGRTSFRVEQKGDAVLLLSVHSE